MTLPLVLALLGAVAGPAFGGKLVHVPATAKPGENGAALLDALNGIKDATQSSPYLITLDPGTYDVGSTMLEMKPFVEIEGASQTATIISGLGYAPPTFLGVVKGASWSALRNLRIRSEGSPFRSSVALLIQDANTTVQSVAIESSGATETNYGIRHLCSAARLKDVTIEVGKGQTSIGLSNRCLGLPSSPSIEDTSITVSNASMSSIGISSLYAAGLEFNSNLQISVSGANSIGIRLLYSYGSQRSLKLQNSAIIVSGSSSAVGLQIEQGQIAILQSQIRATSPNSSVGVAFFSPASGTIDLSVIAGSTNTVIGHAPNIIIGNSKLEGGPALGPTCANVTDENGVSYSSTCP
jgi:hypothetical protein